MGLKKFVYLVAIAILVAACAAGEPVQTFTQSGRVWPAAPEPARIRFVQEFSGPQDLGIKPSFWGRLVGAAAGSKDQRMIRPMAVAASADANIIYVADPDAQCVHRFDLRRSRYDCLIEETKELLISPVGLAISTDGRVYVADSGRDLVLMAEPGAKAFKRIALNPAPEQPTGLALNELGELFVTSTASHSVRRYDAQGNLIQEYGGRGEAPGQMNFPTYVWITPSNELLVTDTLNFRIQRLDTDDGLMGVFGEAGDSSGSLSRPKGVAMDRHGHIYVVDGGHHAVQIFDREGGLLLAVGKQGQGPGEFWLPSGIFATSEGLIFVADAFNQRVQVFRYEGDES